MKPGPVHVQQCQFVCRAVPGPGWAELRPVAVAWRWLQQLSWERAAKRRNRFANVNLPFFFLGLTASAGIGPIHSSSSSSFTSSSILRLLPLSEDCPVWAILLSKIRCNRIVALQMTNISFAYTKMHMWDMGHRWGHYLVRSATSDPWVCSWVWVWSWRWADRVTKTTQPQVRPFLCPQPSNLRPAVIQHNHHKV